MIHFELLFVYGMRNGFNFILLPMDIQLSQHHLFVEENFLFHWVVLMPLLKINHRCINLFLNSQSIPFVFFFFYSSTILFYCSKIWNNELWVLQLCSSIFQCCFDCLGPLAIPYEFRYRFFHFCKKKDHQNFDMDYIKPVECFE